MGKSPLPERERAIEHGSEGDLFPVGNAQILPDGKAGFSLVQGVEMQPWRTSLKQLFAHPGDDFFTKLADAFAVVPVGFQLLADPARDFRAAHVRETHQAGEVD